MSFVSNPICWTMRYTNHSISEQTSYEPELSDYRDQSISDWVQNLGNIIVLWGGVIWWVLSEIQTLELYNTPPLHFRMNFVRTWIVRFHGPINFGLSLKLREHHNTMGGVIWWVLSEIQWPKLCITPTTPFHNELRTNLNCPISWTNRYRIDSKTWRTT